MQPGHAKVNPRQELHRRELLKHLAAGAVIGMAGRSGMAAQTGQQIASASAERPKRSNPIGVSTYSFWQFREGARRVTISECIDKAAALGFDGVEILHVQMEDESNATLQKLKRQAHSLGLALMGFSTHQGFVTPNPQERQTNVQRTLYQIDVAYRLGIPTMRINTGRWGTIKSFDDFMAKKGIEPTLEGHTDDEAFKWVIDSLEKLLPRAEECGVVLGLENHWGLGRSGGRRAENRRGDQVPLAANHSRHRQLPGKLVRADGEDGLGLGSACARPGQDVLRRRPLVCPRPRLWADRRHLAKTSLPRLDLARIRGKRRCVDRRAEEPGDVEKALRLR